MTVLSIRSRRNDKEGLQPAQTYMSPLLPGFRLPLARLFQLMDRWRACEYAPNMSQMSAGEPAKPLVGCLRLSSAVLLSVTLSRRNAGMAR